MSRFAIVSSIVALAWCFLGSTKIHAQSADSSAGCGLIMENGSVRVEYDLTRGTASFFWNGSKKIADFYSAVRSGDRYLTSKDYSHRTYATDGIVTDITLTDGDKPIMVQEFTLNSENHFLVQVQLLGDQLSSNWIAPITMDTPGGVDIGAYGDVRALQVPFDNDHFRRYNASSINTSRSSYEVSAFYDNASRHGLVVGSLTHDTWKTGISFVGSSNRLDSLTVFGGAADSMTQDVMPHGTVTGSSLSSPIILAGFYEDWRDGMEDFADSNTAYAPRLNWSGGVPFGWNSWGRIQRGITYSKAIAVSDFFAEYLQNHDFQNSGTVYINLDSYWDNLSDSQLASFVAHAHDNGQKAGIYWGPFVYLGRTFPRA